MRLPRFPRRFARDERGAVIVEFALILPIFFTIIFALMEFGRAYQTLNAVYAGAREGARLGAVLKTPWLEHDAIKARAEETAQSMFGFQEADSVQVVCADQCETITVTVFLKMQGFTPLFGILGYPDGIPLRGQAIMRWERRNVEDAPPAP